jgi:hypothetical protein
MTSAPPPAFGAQPPPAAMPTPTMNEVAPPSKPWGAPPPAQGLAQYRVDAGGPAALPLPPPSGRAYNAGAMGTPMPGPPAMPQIPPYGAMPMPGPAGGQGPMSAPVPVQVSKGGIVFLIIGLSAVIAVLILVVVWALLLR